MVKEKAPGPTDAREGDEPRPEDRDDAAAEEGLNLSGDPDGVDAPTGGEARSDDPGEALDPPPPAADEMESEAIVVPPRGDGGASTADDDPASSLDPKPAADRDTGAGTAEGLDDRGPMAGPEEGRLRGDADPPGVDGDQGGSLDQPSSTPRTGLEEPSGGARSPEGGREPPGGSVSMGPRDGARLGRSAEARPQRRPSGRLDLVPPVEAAMGGMSAKSGLGGETDRADPLMPPPGGDLPSVDRPAAADEGGSGEAAEPLRGVRDEPGRGGEPREARAGMPVVARTSSADDPGADRAEAPRSSGTTEGAGDSSDPRPSRGDGGAGDPGAGGSDRGLSGAVPPPPAAGSGRRGGGGLLTFLASVLAAGAVAYGVLWYLDREGGAQDDEAVAVIRQETADSVADLETRLDQRLAGLEEGTAALSTRLDESGAQGVAAPGETEEITARLDELGQRVEAIDSRVAEADAGSGDEASRLDAIEASQADLGERLDAVYAGLPEGGEAVSPDALTPLRTALSAQDERIAGLSQELGGRLDALDARLAELGALGDRIGALEGGLASLRDEAASGRQDLQGAIDALRGEAQEARGGLSDQLASLSSDLDALRTDAGEARGGISDDVAALREEAAADREALRGEIEAIRQRVEERAQAIDAEVARARQAADSEAAQARAQAALSRMQAAIDAGVSYQDPLTEVLGAIDQPVPATLLNAAGPGVRSLEDLRQSFPPLAREALQEAPSDQGRVEGFFRRQLGVRSLEPREGNVTDAVLSRAEDALSRGDLEATLAELEALSPEARAPLEGWISQARARLIVEGASAELATQLDGG